MQTRITINGTNYDSDKIIEATYTHTVNSGQQLNVGVVSSAQLVFKTEQAFTVGTQLTYFNRPHNTGSYTQIGLFVIKDATKQKTIYTYTCYDYLSKLDTIVDTWFAGLTWPKTLAQLFAGVATACGLSADTNFDGAPSSVSKPQFSAVNLRGRQIVQWIAQIAGGFAYAKNNGQMAIRHYGSTSTYTFNNTKYAKLDIANYTAPAPDWIQVAKNNNGDVWNFTTRGVGTTGTNLIKIMGNPFTWGDDYTQTAANYCFNIIIHSWIPSYRPFTMKTLETFGVNAGDKITIDGYSTIVMTKKIDKNGVTFSAVGVQLRSESTELQQQQITYQSPQEWFDQGVGNSEGSFQTASITLAGKGSLNQDCYVHLGYEDHYCELTVAESTGANSGVSVDILQGQVNCIETTGTGINSTIQTPSAFYVIDGSRWAPNSETLTKLSKDSLYFCADGSGEPAVSTDVTCYIDKEATETWFTVEANVITSEPADYTYWDNIQYPNAIKYFVLCLCSYNDSTGETSIYASTIIPRWPNDSGVAYYAHCQYMAQTGSSSYASYEARAKFSFGKNGKLGYKLWTTNSSYHARLLCFY